MERKENQDSPPTLEHYTSDSLQTLLKLITEDLQERIEFQRGNRKINHYVDYHCSMIPTYTVSEEKRLFDKGNKVAKMVQAILEKRKTTWEKIHIITLYTDHKKLSLYDRQILPFLFQWNGEDLSGGVFIRHKISRQNWNKKDLETLYKHLAL